MSTYESLQHIFLIAMPQMPDPLFTQSVVYLWEYNENGAVGVIINKPLNIHLSDLLTQLDIPIVDPVAASFPILHGGPVAMDQGFVIRRQHRVEDGTGKQLVEVTVSSSKQDLVELANGNGLADTLITVGCSAWDAMQLDEEIARNDWLIAPFSEHTLFANDQEDTGEQGASKETGRWVNAAARAGIDLKRLSSDWGHA
jgi:putative transcriptional regulator